LRGAAGVVVLLLVAFAPAAIAQVALKPLVLEKVDLAKERLRRGHDLADRELPSSGWQVKVGSQVARFLDLNADGVLEPDADGISMPPSPFVVPIPPVLLLPGGQFELAFDGVRAVNLVRQKLGAVDAFLADAAVVTELRMRAGVRLAAVDADMSAACERHCDYLQANRMSDGSAGLAAHQEDPGKPRYTPEGAEAGRQSCIGFLGWYATAWHGPPIVEPSLRRFGAAFKHRVAMYYGPLGFAPVRPFVHPADGATEVPRAFGSRGELPNPVPGTTYGIGCGFPIFVRRSSQDAALTAAIVKGPKGAVVPGTFSSPPKPATPEWPHNSGCAVFIPSAPLAPKTRYSVRFEFGESAAIEWSFTTAGT
jgi:hypothetical protein